MRESPATARVGVPARWMSRPVLAWLRRPWAVPGQVLGAGYVDLGGYVLAVLPAGVPRMPNGIGCELRPQPGEPVRIGAGGLRVRGELVTEGPLWNPVPRVRTSLGVSPQFELDPLALAGRGPGLTPYGDDLLAGYAAGLVLWRGDSERAEEIAGTAAPRTTSLSATLLRHAARGELPEPAHRLLEAGDPEPLLSFGHSSGRGLLLGLAVACAGSAGIGQPATIALRPDFQAVGLPRHVTVWIERACVPAA